MTTTPDRVDAIMKAWDAASEATQQLSVSIPSHFSRDYTAFCDKAMAFSRLLLREKMDDVQVLHDEHRAFIRAVNQVQRLTPRTLSEDIYGVLFARQRMVSALWNWAKEASA